MLNLVFRDILSVMTGVFLVVLLAILPFIQDPGKQSTPGIDPQGVLSFEIKWDRKAPIDLDMWLQHPDSPRAVGYSNKADATCNLLRDDLGHSQDFGDSNEEMAVCRRVVGYKEYIFNTHYFSDKGPPLSIDWVIRYHTQTGGIITVYSGTTIINNPGQEITLLRFKLDEDGSLITNSMNRINAQIRSGSKR